MKVRKEHKKLPMLLIHLLAPAAAMAAVTAVWQGAENGSWTNAANWVGGHVPGRVLSLDVEGNVITNGVMGDKAIFNGTETGAKATELDLDGLVSVAGITVSGGASTPEYTIGRSSDQVIPIESKGVLAVAGVDTPPPILRGAVSIGINYDDQDWNCGKGVVISNGTAQVLVVNDYGYPTRSPNVAFKTYGLEFSGEGTIRVDGELKGMTDRFFGVTANGRKLIVNNALGGGHFSRLTVPYIYNVATYGYSEKEIEITANGKIEWTYGVSFDGKGWVNSAPLTVTGEGPMLFPEGSMISAQYKDIKILAPFRTCNVDNKSYICKFAVNDGQTGEAATGFLELAGPVSVTGMVSASGLSGGFKTDAIGRRSGSGSFGSADVVRIGNGAEIRYVGSGEVTDRTLFIGTPKNDLPELEAQVRHLGTGVLTWEGDVTQGVSRATLVLETAAGASGVWSGVLKENAEASVQDPMLSIVKRGTGTWMLSGDNAYCGETMIVAGKLVVAGSNGLGRTSGVVLLGGTLELSDSVSLCETEVSRLSLSGADAVITLGANRRLVLAEEPSRASDEVLNIVTAGSASRIKVVGQTAGPAPAWIRVNGAAATYGADGLLYGKEAVWYENASGDWSEVVRWEPGVPNSETDTYLDLAGEEYAVSVTQPAAARKLAVANASSSVMLNVSSRLEVARDTVMFGRGARVSVGQGGSFTFDAADSVAPTVPDEQAMNMRVFSVAEGAQISVTGGLLAFTNLTGLATIGSDDASATSRVTVADGATMSISGSGTRGQFTVASGGLLEVTNAVLENSLGTSVGCALRLSGGLLDVSGSSAVRIRGGGDSRVLGGGSALFREDSALWSAQRSLDGTIAFTAASSGESGSLSILDHSVVDVCSARIDVGRTAGSSYRMEYATTADWGNYSSGFKIESLRIGSNYGNSEFVQRSGTVYTGHYGLYVGLGFGYLGDSATTGSVTVAGGTLISAGTAAVRNDWDSGFPQGTLIGYSGRSQNAYAGAFRGSLTVSSGTFRNDGGHLILGGGYAVGEMHQTGGVSLINSYDDNYYYIPEGENEQHVRNSKDSAGIVGFAGGEGLIECSGGQLDFFSDLYVGGADASVFMNIPYYRAGAPSTIYRPKKFTDFPFDRAGAKGVFRVSGGNVTMHRRLVLGAKGEGALEIVGAVATLDCANLVLSNQTGSAVKFMANASGRVTPVNVSGTLSIAPGARIVVDVTDCPSVKRIELLRADTVDGTFAPENVLFVGAPQDVDPVVVRTATGFSARLRKGLILVVR